MEITKSIFNQISVFDLIYLAITIFYLFRCTIKGFVLSLFSAAKWLLAYVLTLIIFPKVKPYVKAPLFESFFRIVDKGFTDKNFREDMDENVNVWSATIDIELVNSAILLESS